MEAVCQFYEDNPHIIIQGKENPLEILRLHGLFIILVGIVLVVHCRLYFGKSVYKRGNLGAKKPFNVFYSVFCIFNNIMQKGSYNRFVAQAYLLNYNLCHCNWVYDIWLSRASADTFMCLICKLKCPDYILILFLVRTPFETCYTQRLKFPLDKFVVLLCKHIRILNLLYLVLPPLN